MVAEQLVSRRVSQREVLEAMGRVPRELFLDPGCEQQAYDDRAVGIGGGQTISQPYMVARMTELLDLPGWRERHPDAPAHVLDVGTGSGYQAAILSDLGAEVVSIERDPMLAEAARDRLVNLGYAVEVLVGDGSEGHSARAPYTGIVVAAAAPSVPVPLTTQLALDGRLVLPVGRRDHQWLTLVERTPDGMRERELEPCVFVPLVGRFGFSDQEAPG